MKKRIVVAQGSGLIDIINERIDQIEKHGYTIQSDFENNLECEMRQGIMFLLGSGHYPDRWSKEFREKIVAMTPRKRLIVAAALMAALVDRMDYAAERKQGTKEAVNEPKNDIPAVNERNLKAQGLTKENFFNDMTARFPYSMFVFNKWIDEYKKQVGWNQLFKVTGAEHEGLPAECYKGVKFHDLPEAMQVGIWFEFLQYRGGCNYSIENIFEFDLPDDIDTYFGQVLELEATNDWKDGQAFAGKM